MTFSCPDCGSDSRVTATSQHVKYEPEKKLPAHVTKRRRACFACGIEWVTAETVTNEAPKPYGPIAKFQARSLAAVEAAQIKEAQILQARAEGRPKESGLVTCPHCQHDKAKQLLTMRTPNTYWRRYSCRACARPFYTATSTEHYGTAILKRGPSSAQKRGDAAPPHIPIPETPEPTTPTPTRG